MTDKKTRRAKWAFELYNHGKGDENQLQILYLISQGVDVQATDNLEETLLHYAANYEHFKICDLLIQQNANIEAQDTWGRTPLYVAAQFNKPKTTISLLTQGANIWAGDNKNETVLTVDTTALLKPHRNEWVWKLDALKVGNYSSINTTQDLYHLASVMQPENRQNIPPPQEFIRILFQQYLPHELKFNQMYEEIFSSPRLPVQDLKVAREAAKSRGVAP